MKKLILPTLLALGLALGLFVLRRQPDESRVPFYLAQADALRQLPPEDVLRMREDILKAAAKQPDRMTHAEPPAEAELLAAASLTSGAREAKGRVLIQRGPEGEITARLEDFRVANAPGLELYVSVKPPNSSGRFQPEEALRVVELDGNAGSQNLSIPKDIDPSALRSATVWSDLFRMVFARAEFPDQPGLE